MMHVKCSSSTRAAEHTIQLLLQAPVSMRPNFSINQPVSLRSFAVCRASATDQDGGNKQQTCPLPPPPNLKGKAPRKYWNAAALAFLGDSVWELYVRRRHFHPPTRVSDYYAIVVSQVRAETQAKAYDKLDSGDFLTDEERDILRWGRNAAGTTPKRVSQGGMTKEIYRAATAIECLAGYLYLTDPNRLHSVMIHLGIDGDGEAEEQEGSQ